jgi:hypothetical protein
LGLIFDRWPEIPLSTKSDVAKNPGPVLSAYLPAGSGRVRTGWTSGSEGIAFNYAHTALSDFVNSHTTRRFSLQRSFFAHVGAFSHRAIVASHL